MGRNGTARNRQARAAGKPKTPQHANGEADAAGWSGAERGGCSNGRQTHRSQALEDGVARPAVERVARRSQQRPGHCALSDEGGRVAERQRERAERKQHGCFGTQHGTAPARRRASSSPERHELQHYNLMYGATDAGLATLVWYS